MCIFAVDKWTITSNLHDWLQYGISAVLSQHTNCVLLHTGYKLKESVLERCWATTSQQNCFHAPWHRSKTTSLWKCTGEMKTILPKDVLSIGGWECFLTRRSKNLPKMFNWVMIWWQWRPHHMIYNIFILIKPFIKQSSPVDRVESSWKRPLPKGWRMIGLNTFRYWFTVTFNLRGQVEPNYTSKKSPTE